MKLQDYHCFPVSCDMSAASSDGGCVHICFFVKYQICPFIAAQSLYQSVLLATVQHTGLCLIDLPSSTQSVFSHSPLLPANSLSLSSCLSPPPVLSCRSACSSHSPNGNRQIRQHDSDNIMPQRTIFVRLLAESLVLSINLL